MTLLNQAIIVSSGNKLQDTLNKSMSSYFLAEISKKEIQIRKVKDKITKMSKPQNTLSENDCCHRKDGKCSLKSCVNYLYECDRPNMCIKQKR